MCPGPNFKRESQGQIIGSGNCFNLIWCYQIGQVKMFFKSPKINLTVFSNIHICTTVQPPYSKCFTKAFFIFLFSTLTKTNNEKIDPHQLWKASDVTVGSKYSLQSKQCNKEDFLRRKLQLQRRLYFRRNAQME